jgi:hypothetical protein
MVIFSTSIDSIDIENHYLYQENKIISIQLNETRSSIKKRKNKNKKSNIVNCYLKWDDHAEEKNYLEKMHKEIINIPAEETLKSLHKFGHLGYLREEIYDGDEYYVIKHLFSEAWSKEDDNNESNSNKKDRYCKVSSDVLKTRLPDAIKITIQREKLEQTKNNKSKITTRIGRERQQKKKQQQEKQDSSRVKSLKDFVGLLEEKENEGKNPRVYISYYWHNEEASQS